MDDIADLLEAVALCELWLRMGSAVCPDVDFTDVDFTADPQQVARALRAEVERRMATSEEAV